MIVKLMYVNPINNQQDVLELEYPNVDYFNFKRTKEYINGDIDLINILNDILKKLDCTIEYNCGRVVMTNHLTYKSTLSEYYFYLSRITNQFIYNEYIDKVIKRHIDNIVFEYQNPYIPPISKKKIKSSNKKKAPNKFVRHTTKDMFTGKTNYIYHNPRTKEDIESDNPNLLNKLNAPKKKERKTKTIGVPLSAMTFSFKKK